MSTAEHLLLESTDDTPASPMKGKKSVEQQESMERKSLQTLQFSPTNRHLVGSGLAKQAKGHVAKGKKANATIVPCSKPLKIYADDSSENEGKRLSHQETAATQTDDDLLENLLQERLKRRRLLDASSASDDASLVTGEKIPDKYWELLAEERRIALEETLKENRNLHEEVTRLKAENEGLQDTVTKAQSLAALLETAFSDEEDDNDQAQTDVRDEDNHEDDKSTHSPEDENHSSQ